MCSAGRSFGGSTEWVTGCLEVLLDELVHVAVEGRGEQQPLALRGEVEDPAHRRQEAHVGHQVGLVEHRHLHVGQVAGAALDQVLEASGRRDDDVDPGGEVLQLTGVADTAVDGHGAQPDGLGEEVDGAFHLHGQLAGRHEHEAGGTATAPRPVARGEACHQRQGERDGLAGTGRAASEHVAPGEGVRQGGRLDAEGLDDVVAGEDGDQVRGHTEISEGRQGVPQLRRVRGLWDAPASVTGWLPVRLSSISLPEIRVEASASHAPCGSFTGSSTSEWSARMSMWPKSSRPRPPSLARAPTIWRGSTRCLRPTLMR